MRAIVCCTNGICGGGSDKAEGVRAYNGVCEDVCVRVCANGIIFMVLQMWIYGKCFVFLSLTRAKMLLSLEKFTL